jgi:hypothetical protein
VLSLLAKGGGGRSWRTGPSSSFSSGASRASPPTRRSRTWRDISAHVISRKAQICPQLCGLRGGMAESCGWRRDFLQRVRPSPQGLALLLQEGMVLVAVLDLADIVVQQAGADLLADAEFCQPGLDGSPAIT